MKHYKNNRRLFVKNSALALGALSLFPQSGAAETENKLKKKVVCVGGHPDDPETGCGGTLAKLAGEGHLVTIIYLTTGEAGIADKSHEQSAVIRREEATKACAVLKAKAVFAGQVDGDTAVDNSWVEKIHQLIETEAPDIVFTHWPIDSHKDHQCAVLLTIQSWIKSGKAFPLYFFEVSAGYQTYGFNPTDYVDISGTAKIKKQSVYCHKSQNPELIYAEAHTAMEEFRGREIGVKAAEAFVRMNTKMAASL